MSKNKTIMRITNIIFGFLAVTLFIFNFFVLIRLQPKMINFEGISEFENGLLTAVGFNLLVILVFYLLSLWHFVRYLRNAEAIKPLPLFLVISGVLSLLFIFSDIALLTDIHKQYLNGLSQPEWRMVFPIMAGQFTVTLLFLFVQITDRYKIKSDHHPVRDINIFLILQYVGVISGVMGLALASLAFFFPSGWNLTTHGVLGGIVLLFPYGLALLYWLFTKFQEGDRQWFDEKQSQDIGKSALMTLIVTTLLMLILFISYLWNLSPVVQMVWLPIHLYATILIFSIGNLYLNKKG